MTVKDPMIVVDIDGELVVAIGTPESIHIQSENKEYVKTVKYNMNHVTHVPLLGGIPYRRFPTGRSTYLEIAAAIVAVNYGQAVIVEAPDEVKEVLKELSGNSEAGTIH